MSDIPQWAIKRADDLSGLRNGAGTIQIHREFARYIAAHEEPPLLKEALAIIAETYGKTRYDDGRIMPGDGPPRVEHMLAGKGDNYWEMRALIAALRRGIELARNEEAPK